MVVAGATASAAPIASLRHRTAGRAGCSWKIVSAPKSGGFAQLHGMSALSRTSIWAVGNQDAAGAPLALHYNGNAWSAVATPDAPNLTDLNDVDALSASNAWAVGYFSNAQGHRRTLIEHWNGHVWKIVASPNDGTQDNTLHAVSAVSASNIWAVGITGPEPGEGTLIEHWNGTKWSLATPADIGEPGTLDDVAAISASNVVAVGHRGITAGATLIERFNGSHWSEQASADPSEFINELWGVSAPSAGAQWAVGDISNDQAQLRTLAERSTGGAWQSKPPANVTSKSNELLDVSALSATTAFAVGDRRLADSTQRTLAEKFSGGTWKVLTTPNSGSFDNVLEAVQALAATNVWAAGTASHQVGSTPLIEHYSC
jgi:hypothetical protein